MSWYAAHVIMMVKLKKQPQTRFPIWENIYLVRADSDEEAFAKAEKRGREEEGDDDGSFRWGNARARWVFAAVRKITLCQDDDKRPRDGAEITFLEMELRSEEAIRKLLAGEPVSVKLTERFAAEHVEDGALTAPGSANRNG